MQEVKIEPIWIDARGQYSYFLCFIGDDGEVYKKVEIENRQAAENNAYHYSIELPKLPRK